MPHGGLALDSDVMLIIVDIEARLGGILDPPDDDRGDLDRVAALVIHLEFVAVEVAGASDILTLLLKGFVQKKPLSRTVPW